MASTPRKRSYEQLSNESLQIKLADAAPLTVNRLLVATFSGCARGLPADAESWELCNMLVEGVPVERAVVVAWLNAAYIQVENAAFEAQQLSELSTLSGLAQVLTFADAVDSSKGLICALVTQLQRQNVTATVQLGQLQVSISTSLCHIWDQSSSGWGLYSYSPSSANTVKQGAIMASDQKAQLIRLLAAQTEAALHIVYKLHLPYVQTLLYNFIRNNSCWFNSLLYGALKHIFSERVLYAAAGATRAHKELLAASTTTQAFTLAAAKGGQQLLKPVGLAPSQMQPIRFTAELLQDCFGCSRGEHVPVELDLFRKSTLRVGKDPVGVTVQLLAGPADMKNLFGP